MTHGIQWNKALYGRVLFADTRFALNFEVNKIIKNAKTEPVGDFTNQFSFWLVEILREK